MPVDNVSFGQTIQQMAKAPEKKAADAPFGQTVSELAQAKKQSNAAILQASAEVSLSSGNEPLSVVFRAALENINQVLFEVTGEEKAIQSAVEQGVDFSPEATADRIVSLSTAFFGQYQEAQTDIPEDEAKQSFVDLIRGGIEKGFAEARSILDSLSVLEGEVAENIDKTYQLAMQGLDRYLNGADSDATLISQASSASDGQA